MSDGIDIVDTLGVQLVQIYIAVFFYGIVTIQTLIYWTNYRDDGKWIRLGVGAVWLMETVHTIFCVHLVYFYAVIGFGNVQRSDSIIWSFGASSLTAIFIAVLVQSFFVRRIYILSQKKLWLVVPLGLLLFIRICLGFAAITTSWIVTTWEQFHGIVAGPILLACALSSAAAVDLCIWVSLLWCLQKSRTGCRRTDALIKYLQVYIVNTGCLTMIISIVIVLTFTLIPTSLLFAGMVQIQSKIYANCLLASLNARALLNNKTRMTADSTGVLSMELVGVARSSNPSQRNDMRRIEVFRSVTKTADGPVYTHDDKAGVEPVDTIIPGDEESGQAKPDPFLYA